MDSKTRGAWIVHHVDKLQLVTGTSEYENLLVAGKMGLLLSAFSATQDSTLSKDQVNALAVGCNVSPKLELPTLLEKLADRKVIEKGRNGIDVLGITSSTVLTHTAEAFSSLEPTPYEQASLTLANTASEAPLEDKYAIQLIGDEHKLAKKEVIEFLGQSEEIGFVDAEVVDKDRKVYFNGNLFRRHETKKIQAVFGSLKEADISRVNQVDELLKKKGCIPLARAKKLLEEPLFEKLHAIGMYDVCAVENEHEAIQYVTKPAAFHKFSDPLCDDALHLAKALVASLTYGMTRSSPMRGRITMLPLLLGKLIGGKYIGPADAIGKDYRFLEMKRVVEIHSQGNQYYMRLLKKDVGQIALQVLIEGQATDAALTSLQSASVTRFRIPEDTRSKTRKLQTAPSKLKTRELLMALRTGQV